MCPLRRSPALQGVPPLMQKHRLGRAAFWGVFFIESRKQATERHGSPAFDKAGYLFMPANLFDKNYTKWYHLNVYLSVCSLLGLFLIVVF